MNNQIDLLDLINLISFYLQLQNNEELQKQTSNDEILKRLHDDVMMAVEDNRKLCAEMIEQNKLIISKMEELYEKGKRTE